MFIAQSGLIRRSLVAFSTRTVAEEDEPDIIVFRSEGKVGNTANLVRNKARESSLRGCRNPKEDQRVRKQRERSSGQRSRERLCVFVVNHLPPKINHSSLSLRLSPLPNNFLRYNRENLRAFFCLTDAPLRRGESFNYSAPK